MDKTIVVESPCLMHCTDGFIAFTNRETEEVSTFPIDDIGMVIIENARTKIEAESVIRLSEENIAIVFCDRKHFPYSQILPYSSIAIGTETTAAQIKATEAMNGRIWKHIARRKILNQAKVLDILQKEGGDRLRVLAQCVKNHDVHNCEGQAARIYFSRLMPSGVTRDRFGTWPNAALNYGYAIVKAAMSRALVGSGLICIRGIHHHNKYDSYCLSDDMMEAYRPYVDLLVYGGEKPFDGSRTRMTKEVREALLAVLMRKVKIGSGCLPLITSMAQAAASLARIYMGKDDRIVLPEMR